MLCSRTVRSMSAINAERSSGAISTAARMASAVSAMSYGLTRRGGRRVALAVRALALALQLLVARDRRAARRRELDEDDALPVLRVTLEEPAQGAKALGQPLRVVHALDADAEELGGDPELLREARARGRRRLVPELRRPPHRARLDP